VIIMFETYGKQMLFESLLSEQKGGISRRASAPSNGLFPKGLARRSTDALYADAGLGIPRGLQFDVQIVSWTAFVICRRSGAITPFRRLTR
jgi:hypothetical protein